jgi:trehalose synthase
MIREIRVEPRWTLGDYDTVSHLVDLVRTLRIEASILVPALRNRTVWMVNSADKGGGVAEMLPQMVTLLTSLGVPTRWIVIGSDKPEFFRLTKRIHNLIHGVGEPGIDTSDRALYEAVIRENADALQQIVEPGDILVIHDPQPLATGAFLKLNTNVRAVWRCHIGLDEHRPTTRSAWHFLRPYVEPYDLSVFSAPEYIPDYLAGRATIIHPGLDPFSHKNRDLSPHKLVGVLCNAGLKHSYHPVLTPAFSEPAERLRPDGSFALMEGKDDIGLLYRPIVTQISRWDRLKGFLPLLAGFIKMKRFLTDSHHSLTVRDRRRIELVRLILAGPDPGSVPDDPEAHEILTELVDYYMHISPEYQADVAILKLPMASRKTNALMVNALQRCSTVVLQNSLQEGFGLTATEGMWKGVPIVGTRAYGLRQQIRNSIDGVLIQNPEDTDEIARRLDDVLRDVKRRLVMARSAQQRVHDEFLIFTQLCHWLRALSRCATLPTGGTGASQRG